MSLFFVALHENDARKHAFGFCRACGGILEGTTAGLTSSHEKLHSGIRQTVIVFTCVED